MRELHMIELGRRTFLPASISTDKGVGQVGNHGM